MTIRFFPAVSGSATFTARCTCPVLTDCKHAVALMLTALDRASVAKKALSEHPRPVGVPGAAAKEAAEAKGPADSKSADVAEAKKSADPLAALRASGALTTAAKLPAPDAATAEPENTQGSFALNELGTSRACRQRHPPPKSRHGGATSPPFFPHVRTLRASIRCA